jgi:hypothetical protein
MKLKHTLHVLVDNFSTTYKLLLYRIVVSLLFVCIYTAIVYPFISKITGAEQFKQFSEALTAVGRAFANLDLKEAENLLPSLKEAQDALYDYFMSKSGEWVWIAVLLLFVYFVQRFLHGLGNYTTGAIINDKMALRANSPFIGTAVKNLGKAALYNVIYVPIAILYDMICVVALYFLFFKGFAFIPIIFKVFLFVTVIIFLVALKMTFTSDWLPSLIYGKKNNRQAMKYSFGRKNKSTATVLSNFIVMVLVILAVNVASIFFTFGAGLLISVPASYLLIISFEFVNYCDDNNVRYFTDRNTIIKPEKEHTPTREEFFKGDN